MRRALLFAAVVVVAAAACVGLIAALAARDSGQVSGASGPGVLEPDRGAAREKAAPAATPPTSGPHLADAVTRDRTALTDDQLLEALQLGNVVLTYPDARPPAALVAIQRDVSGPFDPALAAAGQAVILARRPDAPVLGLAWRRRLAASGPDDPRLHDFAEAWLGQGAR